MCVHQPGELKRRPSPWRHDCSVQEVTEGTVAITLHVCRRNVVILDSPCQAISLITVLIWNVGLWFVFLPPLASISYTPPTSTQSSINTGITIARGNLSILLPTHPVCVLEFSLTLGSICISLPQGPELFPSTDSSFLFMKIRTPLLWKILRLRFIFTIIPFGYKVIGERV